MSTPREDKKKILYLIGEGTDQRKSDLIRQYIEDQFAFDIYNVDTDDPTKVPSAPDLIILPFAEGNTLEGIPLIRKFRKKTHQRPGFYGPHCLFIFQTAAQIPDFLNPHKVSSPDVVKLLANPEFKDTDKATLLAETLLVEIDNHEKTYLNFIEVSLSGFKDKLIEKINYLLSRISILVDFGILRKKYYETFIYYYDNLTDSEEKIYEAAYEHYRLRSCIKKESYHRVGSEIFRAPLPFPLSELADNFTTFFELLSDRKIKLLLLDNDPRSKFVYANADKECFSGIGNILRDFGLHEKVEVEMLGGLSFRAGEEITESAAAWTEGGFDLNNFKLLKNYQDKVYDSISRAKAHFVLLDFFLNKENTYLAIDFIKDFSKIKKMRQDPATTWFFITSAVYDSVTKYSQSGVLAEFYDSAIVNSGDDPTNKRRQIIFLYKLLTFINARLKSACGYKDVIENMLLSGNKDYDDKLSCCVYAISYKRGWKISECSKECQQMKCLENMQTYIKRYLTEFDNVSSLLYEEIKIAQWKEIIESLDNLIKHFTWLPEADWQLIQQQIDYINAKLKNLGVERRFSCNYINEEIERRSEIY